MPPRLSAEVGEGGQLLAEPAAKGRGGLLAEGVGVGADEGVDGSFIPAVAWVEACRGGVSGQVEGTRELLLPRGRMERGTSVFVGVRTRRAVCARSLWAETQPPPGRTMGNLL